MKKILWGCLMSLAIPLVGSEIQLANSVVMQDGAVYVTVPDRPLKEGSLQIDAGRMSLRYWDNDDHAKAFSAMQRIARVWDVQSGVDQFLVYGKDDLSTGSPFKWEMVPYIRTDGSLSRFWQQIKILWNTTFGAPQQDVVQTEYLRDYYQEAFSHVPLESRVVELVRGGDVFCDPTVIEKQWVLKGRSVNVLYNYAPIGFGGEKLHFLVVPKEHRRGFRQLTAEEYVEANQLSRFVIDRLRETRVLHDAYLFHKTGRDAGQTVPHWHMHLILTTNPVQGIFGKLTVLKNMIFGSSPLDDEALHLKVDELRRVFNTDSYIHSVL